MTFVTQMFEPGTIVPYPHDWYYIDPKKAVRHPMSEFCRWGVEGAASFTRKRTKMTNFTTLMDPPTE